jgi:hypothetical protein
MWQYPLLPHNNRRMVVALCLVVIGLFISLNSSVTPVANAQENLGPVSGTVFRDYDADGQLDSNEPGVYGVTVTAYDATNSAQGTTTTAANGTYNFTPSGTPPYRVEFTGYPAYLYPGPVGGSSVQFVATNSAATLNFGLNAPSEYCQANPNLCTPRSASGAVAGESTRNDPTFYYFPYSASGTTTQHSINLPANALGSTWGVAVQPQYSRVFLAAALKRHAGLGPNGLDAIYITNYTGSSVSAIDLQGITPGNGGAAIDLGSVTRSGGSDFTLPNTATGDSVDLDAFGKVGTVGFGDADMSEDGNYLWLVNLNQKTLIRIDVSGATVTAGTSTVNAYAITSPTCTNGTFRPWGLKFANGYGYVGIVCDGSSGSISNVIAYVQRFDPANPGDGFTTLVTIPMNYNRERISYSNNTQSWQRWANTWAQTGFPNQPNNTEYAYPQPLVGDIEFADDGDMIIGMLDRWANQVGLANWTPVSGANSNSYWVTGNAGGDTLHACFNPATNTYTLEGGAGCPDNDPGGASPRESNDGPSNAGEYYFEDFPIGSFDYHGEVSLGGLARLPGQNEVATNAFDPVVENFEQGIQWYNTNTGARPRGYRLDIAAGTGGDPGSFGKAGGYGDIELLCTLAPLEIGNRVWRDSDGDGIQDANEPGLAGVTVQLYQGATLLSTVVTNANGNYLFSNRSASDVLGADYGVSGLVANTTYQIRIAPGAGQNTNTLSGLALTTADATSGTNSDLRDSDATTASGNFVINLTTGGAGQNNHTYDIGFAPLGAIGNRVWLDEDSNGYQDEGEAGIANVTVQLKNSAGTVIATTVTDSNGYYLFKNLSGGTYFVQVLGSSVPTGLTQTTIYPNAGADETNQNQSTGNGYQVVLPAGGVNLTADFGYNWNPTDDVNNGTGTAAIGDCVWYDADGDGAQDPEESGIPNVTVQLITAGPDGLFGTGDDVISATTTTNNTGCYLFDGLTPGAYVVRIPTPPANTTQTGDPDHWGTTGPNDNQTTVPVVLAPGDVFLDADFGYQLTTGNFGSIGDTVWLDMDADDTGPANAPGGGDAEAYIPNVTVALIRDLDNDGVRDAGEPIIATDITDANGFYLFPGLPIADGAGTDDYLVLVTDGFNALQGLTQTFDHDGSQTDGLNRVQDLATTAVLTEDFGYVYDNSGTSGAANTTLPIGTGAEAPGRLGDRVWLDIDGGDDQDANEPGLAGVQVTLTCRGLDDTSGTADDLVLTTVTGTNGYYLFDNIPVDAGGNECVVTVNTATLPGTLNQTYDASGSQTDSSSTVTLTTAAPTNLNQDFGYQGTGTIGDLVWRDTNADGDNDGPNGPDGLPGTDDDEPGFVGVTLTLWHDRNGNGRIDAGDVPVGTQTTTTGGAYLFSGLSVDDGGGNAQYIVDVTDTAGVLAGYWHSLGTAGTNNHSQIDPYVAVISTASPNNLTADFGYYVRGAAVGNRVWSDDNSNGVQDTGEVGISGVRVTLTITYPGGVITTLNTLTNNDGYYSFSNLLLDEDHNGDGTGAEPTFVISVDTAQPNLTGYTVTLIDAGGNDFRDSDNPAGVTAQATEGLTSIPTSPTDPATEPVRASYDFGFVSALDYGDLPMGYSNIRLTNNGARHVIGAIRLGTLVDADGDGAPTIAANGDDTLDTNDDEDGVVKTPGSIWTAGGNGYLNVTVSGGTGCVAAWIDWNRDSDFADAGERIFVDQSLTNTTQTIVFPIPAGVTFNPGQLLNLRVRLYSTCTGGTAAPTGLASGTGEVEDHQLDAPALGVVMESFEAQCRETDMLLQWETASETDILGFNLWRGTGDGTPDTQVNGTLIPTQSPGGGQGALYEFVDMTVTEGNTYFYWLDAVETSGSTTRFGPVSSAFPCVPTAVTVAAMNVTAPAPFGGLALAALGILVAGVLGGLMVRRK